MITFKTKDYDLYRKSEDKIFTHAVLFRNISDPEASELGATFHVSLKLAEARAKRIDKYSHIVVWKIVEVEAA